MPNFMVASVKMDEIRAKLYLYIDIDCRGWCKATRTVRTTGLCQN